VWLMGGGACSSLSDCQERATGFLGSSKRWPLSYKPDKGMLLADSSLNPDFATWNRIFVPYCSGDLFFGQMTEASNPWSSTDSWSGFFSGHNIVEEVLTDLQSSYGASAATDVILTGCSAGGIGTLGNCDFVAGLLPNARAACRPEAGWFSLPIASFNDWSEHRNSADMHHAGTPWLLDVLPYTLEMPAVAACNLATNGGRDIPFCDEESNPDGCCGAGPYFYPYTKTPMFISQNTMDSYQVVTQGGASVYDTGFISYTQSIIASSLSKSVKQGDGMFASACLNHCMPWSDDITVDGLNHFQAFGNWYFGRTPGSNVHLDNSTTPQC